MRSGSTVWRAPCSRGTPSTTMREVPAPEILAPILLRQSATSPISGSRAAFSITVVPLASVAAIIAVWVPPTVTLGNSISAPRRPFLRARDHIAAFDLDLGAQLRERHDQQIDRPRADGAAAGHRHLGLAHARQQRRHHPEARPHLGDQLVGRGGVDDVLGRDVQRAAGIGIVARPLARDHDVDAVIAEDALQQFDVGQPRHIVEDQRVLGEQARDHERQRGVLGARYRDRAVEALPADDAYSIHVAPPACGPDGRSMDRRPPDCKAYYSEGYHPRRANAAKVGPPVRATGLAVLCRRAAPGPGSGASPRTALRAPAPCAGAGFPAAPPPGARRGCRMAWFCRRRRRASWRHYPPQPAAAQAAALPCANGGRYGSFRRVRAARVGSRAFAAVAQW